MHTQGHEKYSATFKTELGAIKQRPIYAKHKAQAAKIAAGIAKTNGWTQVGEVGFVCRNATRTVPHCGHVVNY